MRIEDRMSAAAWAAQAIRKILRGKKVRLPKNAPPWSADLIKTARLAFCYHTSPRRLRRQIVPIAKDIFTKRNIALALDQADRRYRVMPLIGPQRDVPVSLPFVGSVSLGMDRIVSLMADAFYRIAGVGRLRVGQRERQNADAGAGLTNNTVSRPRSVLDSAPALLTVSAGDESISAAIFGRMGMVIRLTRRISRC